jgi:fatty acid desaturase
MTLPRPKLSRPQLAELRLRGNCRPALYMVAVFTAIVATVMLAARWPHPALLVPCLLVIGALQHHLSIIQHEAVHYLLFTNRRLNDLAGGLAAYPIFFTMGYRHTHWKHHRSLGHDDDPDLCNYVDYPNDIRYLIFDIIWNVTGAAAAHQFIKQALAGRPRPTGRFDRELVGVAMVQATLLGVFWVGGVWELYFLLWILPLVTIAKSLTHFRNVVEHAQLRDLGDPELSRCRTVLCNPIEGFFFAPMNFNYHAEHHFYMGIPYHQLPRCHELLAATPEYLRVVEIEHGYLGFLFGKLVSPRDDVIGHGKNLLRKQS